MGTWGTALFSDDLASDIREDFKELIGDGKTPEKATEMLLEVYRSDVNDYDSGPVFWLSLAAIQWKTGRLVERVEKKALEIINNETALNRWKDDPKQLKKRKEVLDKLKEQLLSPQPLPIKIPKRFKSSTSFQIEDVISYQTSSGKFILFRVIGYHEDKGGRAPVCELLDWVGKEVPSPKEINQMRTINQMMLGSIAQKDFPEERVKLVMKKSPTIQKPGGYGVYLWRYLDKQLNLSYKIKDNHLVLR